MADEYTVFGFDGSNWIIDIDDSDYLAFCGVSWDSPMVVGNWNQSTHKSNAGISSDLCASRHIRNCKYVSSGSGGSSGTVTDGISLNEGSNLDLNTDFVTQTDCTLQIGFKSGDGYSELVRPLFYAYDGDNTENEPDGIYVVAFEHDGSNINTECYNPGSETKYKTWKYNEDITEGVNGINNALVCSDQGLMNWHLFYLGISVSPTSAGTKTFVLRMEFEIN